MDRMAAAVGAFKCIRSDPVQPVDPEKLCRERSTQHICIYIYIYDKKFDVLRHGSTELSIK